MKLFRYKQPQQSICYFETNKQIEIPQPYIHKQVRAMWVSNVLNMDLPNVTDITSYQDEIMTLVETCKAFHINTIFFQVRTNNDAFYASKLNPYSRFYTGVEGLEPPFDVLKWVIETIKKNNIEFHAWCNPYRVSMDGKLSKSDYLETCDDLNFAKRFPEHTCLDQKGQIILNPAKHEVKQHIIDSMVELAVTYGIDGIHFDDYFYPYAGLSETDNDEKEFHNQQTYKDLGDFRRAHVTDVIKGVYHALKNLNKHIQFGVSPFGIYKNRSNDEDGMRVSHKTSQSYDNQYADALLWIKEGILDYIVPQIYWEFGHEIAPFADIALWWIDKMKESQVRLYIGHAAYRLGSEGDYENPMEIVNQVTFVNAHNKVDGNVFFTYRTFISDGLSKNGMMELKKLLSGGSIYENQ